MQLFRLTAKTDDDDDDDEDEEEDEEKKHFILRDINISVRKGRLLAVVGPVGSGKSTLLNALLGQLVKLEGEVTIRGM